MCMRFVRDNLIVGTWSKQRTSIPKGFNAYDHCYYHMDLSGYKIEDCKELGRRIQDWIDEGANYNWLTEQNRRSIAVLKFTTPIIPILHDILLPILLSWKTLN